MRIPLMIMLCCAAQPEAQATIYRCSGDYGEPAFQQSPCPGQAGQAVHLSGLNRIESAATGRATPLLDRRLRFEQQRARLRQQAIDQQAADDRRQCARARHQADRRGLPARRRAEIGSRILRYCF